MTRDVTVSVAMATHNGARYLGEQLGSILAQTRPVDEIVLSDDASTDGTVEFAQGLLVAEAAAPRFVVLRNPEPLRPTRNFEQALGAVTGDIVVLSDQDDRWMPERVSRALARFEHDPALLLLHGDALRIDDAGAVLPAGLLAALRMTSSELREIRSGRAFQTLMRRNLVTGATTAFRRELLDAALPIPAGWVHDEWLGIVAAALGGVGLLEEPLVEYRQHSGNEIGASVLSVGDRVSRLGVSRSARNERLLVRAEGLVDRLEALGDRVPSTRLVAAREKVAHEQARSGYPASRAARIPPIVRELMTGRYSRYGRARFDVVRDLVQPAGEGGS